MIPHSDVFVWMWVNLTVVRQGWSIETWEEHFNFVELFFIRGGLLPDKAF